MTQIVREDLTIIAGARAEMTKLMYEGTPVWVELADDSSRSGSIGLAYPKGEDPENITSWGKLNPSTAYYGVFHIDIYFPDKQKPVTAELQRKQCYWLRNYTGPGKFVFAKKEKEETPAHIPLDMFGHPVAKGNLVIYTTVNDPLRYGIIDSISSTGLTFEVRPINLESASFEKRNAWSGKDTVRIGSYTGYDKDKRCRQVTVIRSDLLTDLMTLRLTMR